MTDYTFDLCPRCQATGTVTEPFYSLMSGGTAITYRERPCEACDGVGRIKVPVGFMLVPKPVFTITTASMTSATKTATG